jgi:histidyl-tRNA synthetase
LGAQNAVLAGGRYDGLVAQMGGPPTPGIGWAAGIERLAMLLGEIEAATSPIAVVPVEPAQSLAALTLAESLRAAGYIVDLGFSGGMGKRMKRANKIGAQVAVIVGEAELARGVAAVRDMHTGAQEEVLVGSLTDHLARYR